MNGQNRLRLDNASLIYPASLSKKYASLYRMRAILKENIDPTLLQAALEATVRRIPTFGHTLSNGSFWWYLTRLEKAPSVLPFQALHRFTMKGNGGFLFRVSANGREIVLDVFHVLTDGHGGMTFLLTLTAEYLRLRYGITPEYGPMILDPREAPSEEELGDSFRSFSGRHGALENNDRAYHLHGRPLSEKALQNIRVCIPSSEIAAAARERNASVTELLAAAMVYALQEVRSRDLIKPRSALKVSVPVDLRRIFGSRTLRNFSSYVYLGVDVRNECFDFDSILRIVSAQKKLFVMPSQLEPKVAKNVELEDNYAIAAIPRFIKKPVIDIINRLKGDRYCSHTLSNLGTVEIPAGMAAQVEGIDFMLGRQRGNTGAAACVSYGGTLYLNISRRIVERDFENRFLEQLERLGLDVRTQESAV